MVASCSYTRQQHSMLLVEHTICAAVALWAIAGLGEAQERARYDNYRLYSAVPRTAEQLAVLKQLESSSDSVIFLVGAYMVGVAVKMVVAPHKVPDFLQLLGNAWIHCKLEMRNIQLALDSNNRQLTRQQRHTRYNWQQYHELNETYSWLESLALQYPDIVTLIEAGMSYENRTILGVKLSKSGSPQPGIFLEAGAHAREWIAPAAATYIINQLLTGSDEPVQALAYSYDWYVFPHVNPDGYVYTYTTDRLWRKTRKPYGSCFGADPSRNWAFHWDELTAVHSPCSSRYAGPEAFSEAETLALSNYIKSLQGKIQLFVSISAYSQFQLYPYDHTKDLPDNLADYRRVCNAAIARVNARYGTNYTSGNNYAAIYPAAGTSIDWVYGTQGVRMCFCYELPPTKSDVLTDFQLPVTQIVSASSELLDSIIGVVNEVKQLGYFD